MSTRTFFVKNLGGEQATDMRNLMSVDDPIMLREIVLQGGGVSLMPEMYCSHDLNDNRLQRVCIDIEPLKQATIYALTYSRRLEPQKTSIFMDLLRLCTLGHVSMSEDKRDSVSASQQ